jgi:hypothetical protein
VEIKGNSPITGKPFNEKALKCYGWMEDERDLWDKYHHLEATTYFKLLMDFQEFKKFNPKKVVESS